MRAPRGRFPGHMEPAHVPDRILVKIMLAVVVVAAGIRFVACTPHRPTAYYMTDELFANGLRAHEDETMRVHGWVQRGSIERPCDDHGIHRFVLQKGGRSLQVQVQVQGSLPDTFRDQAEVIVTGTLVHEDGWRLEGTAMIAKCSDRYNGAPGMPRPEPDFK
jgi:cytochrome c-type biogenesis protein CcmE